MIKLGKTEIPYKYPYMEYRGLVIAGPMDLIVLLLYIYCTYGSGMWVGVLWKHSLHHEGQLLLWHVTARMKKVKINQKLLHRRRRPNLSVCVQCDRLHEAHGH